MGKSICVSGSKGGIGKTTTSINLALSLFNKKENVVLLDANFTSPNVGIYLGHPVTPNSIHEVLSNKIKLDEAMYLHKSGLKIIPGNIFKPDLCKYIASSSFILLLKTSWMLFGVTGWPK